MKQELEAAVAKIVDQLFGAKVGVELTRPEERFGDYATNVALQLAQKAGKNPREIAEAIAEKCRQDLTAKVADVSVAGPGFINLKLTDEALAAALGAAPAQTYAGQEVLVEFGDPNPFKAMHIGHLYSYVVGDAICSLVEAAGGRVRRLSYHGDVGLHVAKALWAMQEDGNGELTPDNIGTFYAKGAEAYEADEQARAAIDELNGRVYAGEPAIQELYDAGRRRSFENFDKILAELGIKNDRRYLESQSAPAGLAMVRENTGRVFSDSDGAVIYEGEKAGLHTRVFITGRGLPTYETKDLGLTVLKDKDYPQAALSIIITAHEQAEYFKVMLAALGEINPALAAKTKHLSHGFVSLSTGKMSSRTGDIYSAADLLASVEQIAKKTFPNSTRETQLGAIKYAFSKQRLGGDLTYDPEESVSLEGNSGPYLQYAHARARSILSKAGGSPAADSGGQWQPGERSLARKISEYPEVVDRAAGELAPHHVCGYLYELAQIFNRFYEANRVIGDDRQDQRLSLVGSYAETLKKGLSLLGIASLDKM